MAFELIRAAAKVLFDEGLAEFWRRTLRFLNVKIHAGTSRLKPDLRLHPDFLPPGWGSAFRDIRQAMEHFGAREIASSLLKKNALSFSNVEHPVVSIIIPVHNKAEYTYYCLRSILEKTAEPSYEVIVVDDASTDSTPSLLSVMTNIQVIRHLKNEGFIASCNDGAARAGGTYLCFLNNDTIVTPSWLSSLSETLASRPSCGAVGARLVYPEGKLQEAGCIVWRDGSALGYGRGDDPSKPEYGYLRDVAYCSGACLLISKDLFHSVGGFDPRYQPAYYEDVDLCFRVREAGRRVCFQPESIVYHLEFSSSSRAAAIQQMRMNQSAFARRWETQLAGRLPVASKNVLRATDERRRRRRILVVDDRIPTPPLGSGFPRAYAMVEMLVRLGFGVSFFPLQDSSPFEPWRRKLQQLGVEVFFGPYDNFRKLLKERVGQYDAVIVSRPHNAAQWLRSIRRTWPDVALIYDAEALYSDRDVLDTRQADGEVSNSRSRALIESELRHLVDADAIINVSDVEQLKFRDLVGERPSVVWGHPLEIRRPVADFSSRCDFLFVGGFLGTRNPNELAITQFARDVLPLVREKIDGRLFIVGANPPKSVRELAGAGIVVVGFVENLLDAYEQRRVFVAPHRVASGIPLKVLEAMSVGIPCVLSDLIAGQLGVTDGREALVGTSPLEMASRLIEAHENQATWNRLQLGAFELIRRQCAPAMLEDRLRSVIEAAIERRSRLGGRAMQRPIQRQGDLER